MRASWNVRSGVGSRYVLMYGVRSKRIWNPESAGHSAVARRLWEAGTYLHAGHVDGFHEQGRGGIANHSELAQSETTAGEADADVETELVKQRGNDNVGR